MPDQQTQSGAPDRYGVLLIGEMVGLVLAAGIFVGVVADPYVGFLLVLIWGCLHLAARKAIRA